MADELKADGASGASPVNADAQPNQNDGKGQSEKPVNLFEIPAFKAYQSSMDQKIQALQRQTNAAEQRAHQTAMAGMDEFERTKYERDLANNRANELARMLEERDLSAVRFERIKAVANETGVPFEILNEAASPDDLALIVARHTKQLIKDQVKAGIATAADKSERNRSDLGGGEPSTTDTRREQALRDAEKEGDPIAYIRLLRQQG